MSKDKNAKNLSILRQFEQFQQKRAQKTSILHSETETTASKIKCFEELFKLTQNNIITKDSNTNKIINSICKSHKNIGQKMTQAHLQQDTELLTIKLENMVHGLKGWKNNKIVPNHQYYPSQIEEHSQQQSSPSCKKFKRIHYKSAAISRIKEKTSFNQQLQKKYLKKYWKIKRTQPKELRCSQSVNAFSSLPKTAPSFTQLKAKIVQYESKAKSKYGITFEIMKNNEEQQTKQIMKQFEGTGLTRVTSMTEIKKYPGNMYSQLVKENTMEDTSVPSHFLGLIRSVSGNPKKIRSRDSTIHRYIRV